MKQVLLFKLDFRDNIKYMYLFVGEYFKFYDNNITSYFCFNECFNEDWERLLPFALRKIRYYRYNLHKQFVNFFANEFKLGSGFCVKSEF